MFVLSVRSSTLKLAAALAVLAVAAAIVVWPRQDAQTGRQTAAEQAVEAGRVYTGVSTNQKRVAFLQSYGWNVKDTPLEVVEITIPEKFNSVYENYNRIQKDQGFDLTRYQGKRVKRWTYRIVDYPGTADEVRGNLLIYNDRVIGGDISTVALNGFMHGFSMPGTASNPQTSVAPEKANIVKDLFSA